MFGLTLNRREHKIVAIVIVLILLIAGVVLLYKGNQDEEKSVKTFEECIVAGYPIMESYPRQCRDGDGNLHIEEIEYPVNPET